MCCCIRSKAPETFSEEDEEEGAHQDLLAMDIYALGVIMWQLWFKEKPYDGKSIHQVIRKVLKGERPSLEHSVERTKEGLHPAPPKNLTKLIEVCWAQDPKNRPTAANILVGFEEKAVPAIEAVVGDINLADGTVWESEIETIPIVITSEQASAVRSRIEERKNAPGAGLSTSHCGESDVVSCGGRVASSQEAGHFRK
jgi:serine/threonine protein kinase